MDHNHESPLAAPESPAERARRRKALCALVTLGAFTNACMATPLNNQELESKDEKMAFAGFVPIPGTTVRVQAQNDFGEWIDMGLVQADSNASVDSIGASWYHWGDEKALPRFPAFWRQVPGQRRLSASVRALAHPYAGEDSFELATFDTTAGECVDAWAESGISAIINNCRSPQTPVVTVTAPCGAEGQACCEENPCDGKLVCTEDQCEKLTQSLHVRVDADGVHSGSWVGLSKSGDWSFKTHLHNGRVFGANYIVGCVLDRQINGQTIGFSHSGSVSGTGILGGDGGDDDKESRGNDARITENWELLKDTGMRCNMQWKTSVWDVTLGVLETLGLVVAGAVVIALAYGTASGKDCRWTTDEQGNQVYGCTW